MPRTLPGGGTGWRSPRPKGTRRSRGSSRRAAASGSSPRCRLRDQQLEGAAAAVGAVPAVQARENLRTEAAAAAEAVAAAAVAAVAQAWRQLG